MPLRTTLFLMLSPTLAAADPATVETIEARPGADGWTVSVTLRHGDTGWDDYADGWRVEAPDGTVLGTRTLLHPHVDEQPFTRSLSGVAIPDDLAEVRIRTSSSPEGWEEGTTPFTLPR
ncbi:hypothetical protein DXV76_00335 [Rhodobacteraceae bacterium CCMM004]|nr:hypothetical protein DXV76_00335 [Rhodobacteraceae bacterium CCMM004]